MKTFSIDMTPDSHLIQSVINTKITAPEAVSELVDNSFDAGANAVSVALSGDSICVADDGRGCADLESMLAFGRHCRHKSTKLGRYGVGLKNAACGMGEMLSISTTHKGIKRTAEICWSEIAERGWKNVKGQEHEPAMNEKSGTIIEIGGLHRGAYEGSLKEKLAFSFAPAIWNGRTIRVNDHMLNAWSPPIISDRIEREESHDYLPISFKVEAGLTEMNPDDPFILAYEHRIIGGTTQPCKQYNSSSRFVALVTLYGDWILLKHKDGLKDGLESEWLWDRLNILCGDLLQRVHRMGEEVELYQIAAELELALNISIGKAKRPNESDDKKRRAVVGTDRKVREAAKVGENGEVKERSSNSPRRGFGITYELLPKNVLGKVDVNRKRVCVQLNSNHPFIQLCRDTKNLLAIKECAAFLLCNHQSTVQDDSQRVLTFVFEKSSERFMELAASVFETIASPVSVL